MDDFTINENEEPTYKRCYEKCKTCNNTIIENNMNCIKCIDGFHFLNGTNNCYDETLLDSGFYLKNDIFYPCEENCRTCTDSKTNINNITSNNCLSCDKTQNLYLVPDLKNCEPESFFNQKEYYIKANTEGEIIFYNCYNSCALCNKGEIFDELTNNYIHNCLKCKDNYYPLKKEEKSCYSEETIFEGYFLNEENKWEECYERCGTCQTKGNEERMRCLSCKTNYVSKEYNKLVYLKLTEGNCIISCPDNLFLTKEIECASTCPFGTYEYIPNNRCVDECPSSFIINEEKTRCVFSSFNNVTTFSEFKEIVFSNINDFVDAFKVIKGYDFIAQITPAKDLDPIEQIKQRISGIDLGDCIDVLKDIYNISKDEDLS